MGDHIEEIAFLSALLTQVAARIEALKLKYQNDALKTQLQKLNEQFAQLGKQEGGK